MIKRCAWISAVSLVAWTIFGFIYCHNKGDYIYADDWAFLYIFAFIVPTAVFGLSLLGGHVLKRHRGAIRLAVVVSLLYLCLTFIGYVPYNYSSHWPEYLGAGAAPVILYWLILWVISGFMPKDRSHIPPPLPTPSIPENTTPSIPDTVSKDTAKDNHPKPYGIAGWLVIPALGLVWAPIISIAWIYINISLVKSTSPDLFDDPRIWLRLSLDSITVITAISVAVLFFMKKRIAIPAVIGLLLFVIGVNCVQALLGASMSGSVDYETIKPIIHTSVYGAVWIPYFLKSKRVKNTFIK